MKIAFYANSQSSKGVIPPTYWTRGVGGAEAALIWIGHELAELGHEVSVYNNPPAPEIFGKVQYLPVNSFEPSEELDAFILFRDPWMGVNNVNAKAKVFWSCDQQTSGQYDLHVFPWVDYTICISEYHKEYHASRYGMDPDTCWVTDLGVNWNEYKTVIPKVKNRLIYCSVPDRGLALLRQAFPMIRELIPDATLVITADYRLWGVDYSGDEEHRADWQELVDEGVVEYAGAVSRVGLTRYQLEADIHAYPSTYEEMFCMSVAECHAAGAVPVTSQTGAIRQTNRSGVQIAGYPVSDTFINLFVEVVADLLSNRNRLEEMQAQCRLTAKESFPWGKIAMDWQARLESWL